MSTTAWQIPHWAEQTMFDHTGGTATHYSSEGDPCAYAEQTDYLTADGQNTSTPDLVLRLSEGDAVILSPQNGREVRELAQALLACAHVWDEAAA
jgi:hypothetical protein